MTEEEMEKLENYLDLKQIIYLSGADSPTYEDRLIAKLHDQYIKLLERNQKAIEYAKGRIIPYNGSFREEYYCDPEELLVILQGEEGASKGE